LIDRLSKIATPATALTVLVPLRVPALGFVPIAAVTDAVLLVTVFPKLSRTVTVTAGLIDVPATASLGCWLNTSTAGAAGVILKAALVAPVRPVLEAVSV
jgi:hypothetical protein